MKRRAAAQFLDMHPGRTAKLGKALTLLKRVATERAASARLALDLRRQHSRAAAAAFAVIKTRARRLKAASATVRAYKHGVRAARTAFARLRRYAGVVALVETLARSHDFYNNACGRALEAARHEAPGGWAACDFVTTAAPRSGRRRVRRTETRRGQEDGGGGPVNCLRRQHAAALAAALVELKKTRRGARPSASETPRREKRPRSASWVWFKGGTKLCAVGRSLPSKGTRRKRAGAAVDAASKLAPSSSEGSTP